VRSYGQYCSLARALDLVGDRWTLLLIRELLLRGPSRYTDLRDGLPGVATNLLADRLRTLEEAGVVVREDAPPPVAATLFRLTPRGEELKEPVHALANWGVELMVGGPAPDDAFRAHWMSFPAEEYLRPIEPGGPPVRVELRAGDQGLLLESEDGRLQTRPASGEDADAVLSGSPYLVLGTLTGRLALADAETEGLNCTGDRDAVLRLLPEPGAAAGPAAQLGSAVEA
jgi:DNA-binding HxlR family transcriptional regulator